MKWEKLENTVSDQDLKVPILNQQMNWEKLCSNLSFTIENEIWNLHKAGHISNLT